MNIDDIKSFLAIYKYKSISQAALSLYITQPTLSARITGLEKKMGTKFFHRSWQGVELTENGKIFLPHAVKTLANYEHLELLSKYFNQTMNDLNSDTSPVTTENIGSIFKIGIDEMLVEAYGLMIINELTKQFPDVNYSFVTANYNELINGIHYNYLDFIIYCLNDNNHNDAKLLKHEKMVVVLNEENYHQVNGDMNHLKNLNKPLILRESPIVGNFVEVFYKFLEHTSIENVRIINDIGLINFAVNAGDSYVVVPSSLYEVIFKKDGHYKIDIPSSIGKIPIYAKHNDSFIECSEHLSNILSLS